jgi:GNAT superfamily N-acetyltransferase
VRITYGTASIKDADQLTALNAAVADDLTRRFGKGHWSSRGTIRSALKHLKTSTVILARAKRGVVATLRLATKKPWAIDTKYFTRAEKPIYLVGMAVHPDAQGKGLGRRLMREAATVARRLGCDTIRLDAYDLSAGAGEFYAKCGYREVARVKYKGTPLIYYEVIL